MLEFAFKRSKLGFISQIIRLNSKPYLLCVFKFAFSFLSFWRKFSLVSLWTLCSSFEKAFYKAFDFICHRVDFYEHRKRR